jgi:mRNA interferase HigB
MHVISMKQLSKFWQRYPDADIPLRALYKVASKAKWKMIEDVHQTYPQADFVWPHHTVFNFRGGNYRLVVKIEYDFQLIYVEHVLTHTEHDKDKWK